MINVNSYRFSLILLLSIVLGGVTGYFWGPNAVMLKPLGDIFLNLMFSIISPLIFFSVASAIANTKKLSQLAKLFSRMIGVFIFAGIIAALYMTLVVIIFPPAKGTVLQLSQQAMVQTAKLGDQIAGIVSVSDFTKLFLPNNILALIIFSILVGLSTSIIGEKGKVFSSFLQAGTDVFMKLISFLMYYAPIGFFAFFAVLVSELGTQIIESYVRTTIIYYSAALFYFFVGFSFFAYLAAKKEGVKLFWKNVFPAAITALATSSSAASIPVNMQAAKNMKVSPDIYETVIPIGTVLHKQGSILAGLVKIAFLFGVFHMNFLTPHALIIAVVVSILVGSVMGAIPSGGLLGETLILSVYGFPPQALLLIATISIIGDSIATMLNVTGNTVCSMLVARVTDGKKWFYHQKSQLSS